MNAFACACVPVCLCACVLKNPILTRFRHGEKDTNTIPCHWRSCGLIHQKIDSSELEMSKIGCHAEMPKTRIEILRGESPWIVGPEYIPPSTSGVRFTGPPYPYRTLTTKPGRRDNPGAAWLGGLRSGSSCHHRIGIS